MPNVVSPAQAPPLNILRQIVQFSSNLHGRIANNIFYVCFNWRLAALEYIWKKFKLTIGMDDTILLDYPRRVYRPNFAHNVVGFVRMLEIWVPMASVVSGKANKLLLEYLGDIRILPAANKLCIRIDECEEDMSCSESNAICNVLEFAQLLKSLIPDITLTEVTYYSGIPNASKHKEECFVTFMSLIGNRSKNTHLSMYIVELAYPSTIDLIPQVSSLKIFCGNSSDLTVCLVHKCANSLLNLDIRQCNAKTLFYDASGSIVFYPYLQSLLLSEANSNVPMERASVPDVVTLPLLRELNLSCPYPYDDNVLLRGNSATLKRLNIMIDQITVSMLNNNGVFRNKYKSLKLTISKNEQSDVFLQVSDTEMNKFIGSLVGAAQKLILTCKLSVDRIVAAVPPINGFQYLNELSITWLDLSLFDVLRLQRVIPSLRSIHCRIERLGLELEHVAADKLPDHIVSSYYYTGNSLQVWTMAGYSNSHINQTIEYILLLTLANPKFYRVERWPNPMSDYYERIAEAIDGEPYIKYASQLKRLLGAA